MMVNYHGGQKRPKLQLLPTVPHARKHRGRKCEPDCKCKRHTQVSYHKPDCGCQIHKPRVTNPPKLKGKPGRKKIPRYDMCVCKHNEQGHDEFGCVRCAKLAENGRVAVVCSKFRPKDEPPHPEPEPDYVAEVTAIGFISHIDDIATCTKCWQPIKLGPAGRVGAVISAKAHMMLCEEHRQKVDAAKQMNRSNRAG